MIDYKQHKDFYNQPIHLTEEWKTDSFIYLQTFYENHAMHYDPFSKRKDANNFYELNGEQTIQSKTFTIKVILNPI